MKQEELCRKLTEMIAETKAQKLSWRLEVQTTEGNDASGEADRGGARNKVDD